MNAFVGGSMDWARFVVLCWLLSYVASSPSPDLRPEVSCNASCCLEGDIDAAVNEAMLEAARLIRDGNLDPLPLGDVGTPDLYDCTVSGLSSLHRTGCWEATVIDGENATLVRAVLGLHRLVGSCRFSKRLLFVKYRGTITMTTGGVIASVLVHQMLRGEARPDLLSLDVDIPGNVELEVKGSTTLSFVLDALQTLYRQRMKRLIRDALSRRCHDLLAPYLHRVTLDDIKWAYQHRNYSLLLDAPSGQ